MQARCAVVTVTLSAIAWKLIKAEKQVAPPDFIGARVAEATFVPSEPVVLATFAACPSLGRVVFMVKGNATAVMVGKIESTT
jgi:translation elongation factor EF-1alpha